MKKIAIIVLFCIFASLMHGFTYQQPLNEIIVEIPYILSGPMDIEQSYRYGFTDEEVILLAQLLCGSESRDGDGEYDFVWQVINTPDKVRYDQISLILCVVMNRVRDDRFPNTVKEVLYQRNQFTAILKNRYKTSHDIAVEKVREWCDAYDRWDSSAQTIPENHIFYGGNGVVNTSRAYYR